jgi:hypothetical protein
VDSGVDVGEAAGQVDYQVQGLVANKEKLCEAAGEDEEWICKAKVARQWQARNLEAVLNWNNVGSVVRRVAAKWAGNGCAQPRGVRVDVAPTGQTNDLSGLRGNTSPSSLATLTHGEGTRIANSRVRRRKLRGGFPGDNVMLSGTGFVAHAASIVTPVSRTTSWLQSN